jgi:hypothetical protein
VRIESEYDREERRARAGVAAGVALLLVAIAFALTVRFRPEVAGALVPLNGGAVTAHAPQSHPEESATLPPPVGADSARPAPDTALPTRFALLQDTSRRARSRGRRTVVTDILLLPCSATNPRPDGSLIIPPHNPRHRTIVGLPQRPGDPPRGFVVPPHDPERENQVPIQIIPMDSILAHTLRVPPHDPTGFNVVRPDTLSCLPDSSAAQPSR